MEEYIKNNKAAWEEAFENRASSWGGDIVECVANNNYVFFEADMVDVLRKYDMRDKSVAQFCCNNGRELLSLVKSTSAKEGIGFDIAENQVEFANQKAKELDLNCRFVAINILDIGEEYKNKFDFIIITIGALCWFRSMDQFFAVVSSTLKKDGVIIINEQHPFTNMLLTPDEDGYNADQPFNCVYSYFEHEWIGNSGMFYMTQKMYESKTFTDYTHSISEIVDAMCKNGILITGMKEFDYDISESFENLSGKRFPLSWIIEGRKEKLK